MSYRSKQDEGGRGTITPLFKLKISFYLDCEEKLSPCFSLMCAGKEIIVS